MDRYCKNIHIVSSPFTIHSVAALVHKMFDTGSGTDIDSGQFGLPLFRVSGVATTSLSVPPVNIAVSEQARLIPGPVTMNHTVTTLNEGLKD